MKPLNSEAISQQTATSEENKRICSQVDQMCSVLAPKVLALAVDPNLVCLKKKKKKVILDFRLHLTHLASIEQFIFAARDYIPDPDHSSIIRQHYFYLCSQRRMINLLNSCFILCGINSQLCLMFGILTSCDSSFFLQLKLS